MNRLIAIAFTVFILGSCSQIKIQPKPLYEKQTLPEFVRGLEIQIGKENISYHLDDQLISIALGKKKKNTYRVGHSLVVLCKNLESGGTVNKIGSGEKYASYYGGTLIDIGSHMDEAIQIITALDPNGSFKLLPQNTTTPQSRYCYDYTENKMVDVIFGMKVVGEYDTSNALVQYRLVLATSEYFDSWLSQFESVASEYLVKRNQIKADQFIKQEEAKSLLSSKFRMLAYDPKSIGSMVCNKENFHGYVERIEREKIKVSLVGRAIYQPDYYFFGSSNYVPYELKQVETQIVWGESTDWGLCKFKM